MFDGVSRKSSAGFTLLELVLVISIISILSYLAIAKYAGTLEKAQYGTLVEKIAADVRYARELATTSGQGTRVYVDVANNKYYLKWASGAYIRNPMGGEDFILELGEGTFGAVEITGTSFNGGRLDFNTGGKPLNAGIAFSGQLRLISLNEEKRIMITANTGSIVVEDE